MTDTVDTPDSTELSEPASDLYLRQRVEQLERDVMAANVRHAADIERISTAAIDAAEEHEWCSTYDMLVRRLNEHLHVKLRERRSTRTFHVRFNLDLDVQHNQLDDIEKVLASFFQSASLDQIVQDELAGCGFDRTNPDSGSATVDID